MKIIQTVLSKNYSTAELASLQSIEPQLVLVFAARSFFEEEWQLEPLQTQFPNALLIGCSTAGEISNQGVTEETACLTAVSFEHARLEIATAEFTSMERSEQAGVALASQLAGDDLAAILVFGQGVEINGSALISGIHSLLPSSVSVSGGLAGDGSLFQKTFVIGKEGISSQQVVALGLYGDVKISSGSFGGWEPFGVARKVTRSEGNLLFELDGQPALDLYKSYLGDYAADLPASGLLFPFEMLGQNHDAKGLIRTILAVDEEQGSLTLAGNIEEQGYLRLMHANVDNLIDGAEEAAQKAQHPSTSDSLALLVSCVGRKLVMGDEVDEEVEVVRTVLGAKCCVTGFYSYGEICPDEQFQQCQLHNQTMTITQISEG